MITPNSIPTTTWMQEYQLILLCTPSLEKKRFGDQEVDLGVGRTALRLCPDVDRVKLKEAKVKILEVEELVLEAEALRACHQQAAEARALEAEKILPSGKDIILTLCKLPSRERNAN